MTDSNLKSGSWAWPHNGANGPVEPQEAPAATPVAPSPQIASSGPEIGKLGASDGQSSPSTPARDGWGRPLAPVGTSTPVSAPGLTNKKPAENTVPKQRGRPFQPGQSGNPAGRPKGARSKFTSKFITKFTAHFEKHGEEILNKLGDNPAEYFRVASFLLVKEEVLPEFSSYEEVAEFLAEQSQYRDVEIGLDVISGN